jgi:chromatin assembly factor 1 subunit B
MVSQSADRTVRVHGLKPPPSGSKAAAAREGMRPSTALARDVLHTHTLSKVALQPPATPPQAAGEPAGEQAGPGADPQQQQQGAGKALQAALFHDESLNTFFRRLAWSPEGSLLAVPAGVYREHAGQQPQHATYIYARGHWGCPLLSLPCPSKASTVARFCPQVFKLKQQQQQGGGSSGEAGSSGDAGGDQPAVTAAAAAAAEQNALGLPYRLLLAVATMDSVLLYDMQVGSNQRRMHVDTVEMYTESSRVTMCDLASTPCYCPPAVLTFTAACTTFHPIKHHPLPLP